MSTDELRKEVTELLTGGKAKYYELEGSVHRDDEMYPEFPARFSSDVLSEIDALMLLINKAVLDGKIEEWETMSWHREHPPKYSGHDSGSIPMSDRIAELQKQRELL